jgi:hypothetical protein
MVGVGTKAIEPQVLPVIASPGAARGDLARGRIGIVLWGAPIGTILAASAFGSLHILTVEEAGILWVAGSAWLGATCLVNALRCGRTHCWIMGILLPALAGVGALSVLRLLSISWNTFASAVWVIVLGAFVVEWISGPYLSR